MKNLPDLLRRESVEFLAIQESLITGDARFITNLVRKHSPFSFCQSPAQGRSGGLLSIWNTEVFGVEEVFVGEGYIEVIGVWKGCPKKLVVFNVYGPQEATAKKVL